MRRRNFSRRSARRAQWLWGTNNNVQVAGAQFATRELLPSRRVQWLLETGRTHLTHVKTLLWLQVAYETTIAGAVVFPPGALYVVKTTDNNNANYSPFAEPEVETAISNWDATSPTNSSDPYLWTMRLWSPGSFGGVNAAVQTVTQGGANIANSSVVIGDWGSHVQSLFYPNVELSVKRKLAKNEGLTIGIAMDSAIPAGGSLVVNYACRMLLA